MKNQENGEWVKGKEKPDMSQPNEINETESDWL